MRVTLANIPCAPKALKKILIHPKVYTSPTWPLCPISEQTTSDSVPCLSSKTGVPLGVCPPKTRLPAQETLPLPCHHPQTGASDPQHPNGKGSVVQNTHLFQQGMVLGSAVVWR